MYNIVGMLYAPTDETISVTFRINFGDSVTTDEIAISEANEIFKNKLEAAQIGQIVVMNLYQGSRVVKPYPSTRKEAPIGPVDRMAAENMGLQVLSQVEEIALAAELDSLGYLVEQRLAGHKVGQ